MQRLFIILFLLLAGCGASSISRTPTTSPDLESTLRVTGTGIVEITFHFNGGTESFDNVRLPWERTFDISVDDQVSVSAYDRNGGALHCEWEIENAADLIDEADADGQASTSVSCGGTWAGFTYSE